MQRTVQFLAVGIHQSCPSINISFVAINSYIFKYNKETISVVTLWHAFCQFVTGCGCGGKDHCSENMLGDTWHSILNYLSIVNDTMYLLHYRDDSA